MKLLKNFNIYATIVLITTILSGCELIQQTENFQIENLKSDIRIGSALSEKGMGAIGPIRLIKVNKGDFTYAVKKFGKLPKERTRLGAIVFETEIQKVANDIYDNRIILAFDFPAKNNEPVKSARTNFQFTTNLKQLSELKEKTKEKPENIHEMAEMWAKAVEGQGKKENYEYQYLFNTGLKKALITMGERFLNTMPESIEFLIKKYPQVAEEIEKQGGYDAAMKKTIGAESNFNKGLQYLKEGKMDDALSSFDEAIKLDPTLSRAYANRGNIYLQKQQFNDAIQDFNKAIQFAPDDGSVYGLRAIAYYFTKDYNKSWEDVRKAKILGATFKPGFIKELEQASGRKE